MGNPCERRGVGGRPWKFCRGGVRPQLISTGVFWFMGYKPLIIKASVSTFLNCAIFIFLNKYLKLHGPGPTPTDSSFCNLGRVVTDRLDYHTATHITTQALCNQYLISL